MEIVKLTIIGSLAIIAIGMSFLILGACRVAGECDEAIEKRLTKRETNDDDLSL